MAKTDAIDPKVWALAQESKGCQYLEFKADGISYRAVLHSETLKIERASTDALGVKVWIPETMYYWHDFMKAIVKQHGQKATIV